MSRENKSNESGCVPAAQMSCPLCGATMMRRRRDPLVRGAGMLLIYLALLLALIWLPQITPGELLAAALCLVTGLVLLRHKSRLWCPGCWHVRKPAKPAAETENGE